MRALSNPDQRSRPVCGSIACIDQCDATTKAAGINSLGALLDRSRRMVVLLDENNMKRMWCVFEVAAFAKRRSIGKMDLVPVPLALQQAALVASTALTPLMALMMTADEMIGENMFVWILFTIPLMAPPMLLLIHATAAGHVTARALDDLQDFTMAAAECYSPVDRAAIVSLIGQWFADEGEGVDVGLHNFEMFVRMEVRATLLQRPRDGNPWLNRRASSSGLAAPPTLKLPALSHTSFVSRRCMRRSRRLSAAQAPCSGR